jgi:hypothetical protein
MFRKALAVLADCRWHEEAVAMKHLAAEGERPSLEAFQAAYDVVFLTGDGFVNVLAQMTKSARLASLAKGRLCPLPNDSWVFQNPVGGFAPGGSLCPCPHGHLAL